MTNVRRYSIWTDSVGQQVQTQLWGNASLSSVLTAVAAKSVGGLLYNTESADLSPTQADLGGAYDTKIERAVLLFRDASGYYVPVVVPMPLATLFLADNVTVDESQLTAIKAAVIGTVLSAGGLPAVAYVGGYRSSAGTQPAGIPPAGVTPNTLGIDLAGVAVGTEPALNLIAGANVTLTVVDNPASHRVDATIAAAAGGGSGLYTAYLCYQDQKAAGTNGGTFTSGAWQTRTLNTEQADAGNHGSLATNQVTLDAGTYRVVAHVPAFGVDTNQSRLRNITDGTTILSGLPGFARNASAGWTDSVIDGRFTIAVAKVLEVQHRCQTTEATNGFGIAANFGETEVYTTLELWKE